MFAFLNKNNLDYLMSLLTYFQQAITQLLVAEPLVQVLTQSRADSLKSYIHALDLDYATRNVALEGLRLSL